MKKADTPHNKGSPGLACPRLAEQVWKESEMIQSGSPSVYSVPLKKGDLDGDLCESYSFGKDNLTRNRTIMVVGATGAGKSTLINGMINYIFGVEWGDSFRFKLIDDTSESQSQTSLVTVYKMNHQEGFQIPYSVTIVDTPSFGDTRGIDGDKMIVEQIRSLFTCKEGVTEIDAVCLVTQASHVHLTQTQKYVFDSVLSIFGKDVAENIQILVTFADSKKPPVLEAINFARVPCPQTKEGLPVHFKFNNSALFADNGSATAKNCSDDEDDNFDKIFWSMGTKNMKTFFSTLDTLNTQSLKLTKEVLDERKKLEVAVEAIQPQFKACSAKVEEIRKIQQLIQKHEADISTNENFEIEVDIIRPKQTLTPHNQFITNCQQCSVTCHDYCVIANPAEMFHCPVMDHNGYCTVCPGKCVWSVHFNQKYKWEYVQTKEKRTIQDAKEKYLVATEAKMALQDLIKEQFKEMEDIHGLIEPQMEETAKCLARLKEIALRPNPLSTPEYIDLLIQCEKCEAKLGYMHRIRSLEAMKEQATIMSKVAQQEIL